MFHLPLNANFQQSKALWSTKLYRNPVILAQTWQKALDNGDHSSPADLARKLAVSRARVTQVLSLLKLPPDVLNAVAALGDPLPSPILTERRLRSMMNLSGEEQEWTIRKILAERRRIPETFV
jgi:ParB-like chromosome segregation protein Spo0J